jgi:mRNA-degrading endonuclease RelE of RelBE toxin-antitoxin system
MPYEIAFTEEAESDLEALDDFHVARLEDEIARQLRHEPSRQTRNRFPMRPNPRATWELRADPLRVYYDVDEESRTVFIKGVGLKEGNRLRIRGRLLEIREYLDA